MSYKNINSVAFIIQARLSSERAPGKMLRPFGGSTLMDIALEKVSRSSIIPWSQFYLAVHEHELEATGRKHGCQLFHRSRRSMLSEGSPMSELYEWWDQLPFTYGVLISACMPLLTVETIDSFVRAYLASPADGLFGVRQRHTYFFRSDGTPISEPPPAGSLMNTKFVSPIYEAAHCLYAGRLARIGEGIWMGGFAAAGDPELFVVPDEEAVDIDTELDFTIAELLFQEKTRPKQAGAMNVRAGNSLA